MEKDLKNLIFQRAQRYAVIFKIISKCNDFCNFCLEDEVIKSGRPPLTFEELKKNYFYLKKNFKLDYFILTGGEPTLHPQFFEIIDFLKNKGEAFRVITNVLKFNESKFLERFKPIFAHFKNQRQQDLSKIFVSINDLPERNRTAHQRFSGLKKVLSADLPVSIITVIYRDNLKDLPELMARLGNLFKEKNNSFLSVELRLIYVHRTSPELLKISLPTNFRLLKKKLEESLGILTNINAGIELQNIPLCYLDEPFRARNINLKMAERLNRLIIEVNKEKQLEHAKIINFKTRLKSDKSCQECQLDSFCSGIEKGYIKEYNFPKLKPLA